MKRYIFGLMATAALVSCSNDEIGTMPVDGQSVINASFEGGVKSRAGFMSDESAVFFWNTGDKISVHTTYTSSPFATYSLASGAGKNSATFTGTLVGNGTTTSVCALYPANAGHSVSGNTLTFHMPDSYTYTYADDSFGLLNNGASNSTNMPMLALIGENGSTDFSFKHLGGVFCFQIAKIPATATKFVFTANSKINGDFTVDLSSSSTPFSISTTSQSIQDAEKTVTINFTAGVEKRVFYIPVPTGTYAGFKWEMKDNSDTVLASFESSATNTVSRTNLVKMPLLTCSTVTGGITSSVAGVSALNTLLGGGTSGGSGSVLPTSVTVTQPTNISAPITIPTAITAPATNSEPGVLNLTFDEVPTASSSSSAIEIKDGSTTTTTPSTESKSSIEIAIPPVTSGATAPSFNIALPTATVTLAATGDATTYNEVTATTAENTLVIGKGVTVKTLKVKGGNVRVNSGGKVESISRETGNTSTVIIYKEEDATLPDNLSTTIFQVVDAAVADLQNVAKKGGTYTLTQNLILSSPLNVQGPAMTLDLNGHSIKPKTGGLDKILNTLDALILVRRGASLTINDSEGGGSVDCNGESTVYAAVKLTDTNDGPSGSVAKLVVNGGTFTGYYAGICGNGTRHNTDITINGGTITSAQGPGIYHPQSGTLTISGGEISGLTGIEIRAGELVVNGGKIKGTASIFEKGPNGNGNTIIGAAVAVSQHTTNLALKATITGASVLDAIYALYEEDLQNDESTDQISLAVSGGTLNGKVYSENCTSFITGGTFSDPSAVSYMNDAANITVQLAANTTLEKTICVEKGTATIDLNQHTLTAGNTATVVISNKNKVATIAVKDGATAIVKNGTVGDDTTKLPYGVYAFGKANVTLTNVQFGSKVTYAYNGTGKLAATDCTFRGWLSGWHQGGTFANCTFTIGKAYYPAAICYGSTTFNGCKFFKSNVDADVYDDGSAPDNDGYYRCNYVVAQCNPSKSIGFTNCKFINEGGSDNGSVSASNHPFHACGWGDGVTANYDIKVDGSPVTSYCSDYTKAHNAQ